jgi:DUF1680 family protein
MHSVKRQLEPVPFTAVTFEDAFWAPRLEVNRTVTIAHIYRQLEASGRIGAFDLNFQRPIPSPVVLIFGDSDVYKWLEAASFVLTVHADPALAALVDRVADKITHAQMPDGYLNTHFIVAQPEMRWHNLRDWHELYCAGHLVESAIAHHQATGQHELLDAAARFIDLIDNTFGREAGKKHGYCGHPELELALVKLYHATQDPKYLRLATYLVDERGTQPHYFDLEARQRGEDPADFQFKTYEYCQAQVPLRKQTKVVGHAVRAMYLLSAAADLAHENDDSTLLETCQRLWDNLVTRRIYLTGGIGAGRDNEGFTQDYDLPDETAYAETCATIGLIQWNQRLLQFSGESKYADEIERGLYNGFLSGVSLEGDRFFYENPLASAGNHHRQSWFDCPCCPPNLARTLAGVGGYFYSTGENSAWIHLYAQGSARLSIKGNAITLRQETQYPWDGAVKIEVRLDRPQTFSLRLRVPGWCEHWQASINGTPVAGLKFHSNGYLAIEREWHSGDVVSYRMEMPIQTVWAHPNLRDLQSKLALQRGPMVYCLEGVDNARVPLSHVALDPIHVHSGEFGPQQEDDLLGGVSVIYGKGSVASESGWKGVLYRNRKPSVKYIGIKAIPYYAWDNREPGEMRVWLVEK